MKRPWKKNVFKLSTDLLKKVEELESNELVVGAVKQIPVSEIKQGVYSHIGIEFINDSIQIEDSVLPSKENGRYSKYNKEGRTFVRKDLPKISKTYSAGQVPNFGDWSKGSHEMSWTKLVRQKEHWYEKNININLEKLEENETTLTIKFSLDTQLKKDDPSFEKELLFHINLFMENTGVSNIFSADATNEQYISTLYVKWELLPPGQKNINSNVEQILMRLRSPSEETKQLIIERIEFFESLKPTQYIVGENRFSKYFGAVINDKKVILENVWFGNAIYIFNEDWKELTRLSRTQLLSSNDKNFERVTHTGNWKIKVTNILGMWD
ncbi:hypothetical protein [Cohnella herbarum]|uniref:Uncharacterized protein n=1 Tax=Cohnella herbarum TaxID=2728023 RepID=A0A7Z2ZQ56_9BACL|nr:hypothetical protein [Cohnella herbarum]QJD87605.1 hypothetical protein HH215_33435 [Cohnella herbarum]